MERYGGQSNAEAPGGTVVARPQPDQVQDPYSAVESLRPDAPHQHSRLLERIEDTSGGRFQLQGDPVGVTVPVREQHVGASGGNSIVPSFSGYELGQAQADERAGLQRGQASNMWQGPPGIAGSGGGDLRGVDAHGSLTASLREAYLGRAQIGGSGNMPASMPLHADSDVYAFLARSQPAQPRGSAGPGASTGVSGLLHGAGSGSAVPGSVERSCQLSSVIKMCPHRHPA